MSKYSRSRAVSRAWGAMKGRPRSEPRTNRSRKNGSPKYRFRGFQRVIQARGVAQQVITFAKAEFAYHHIADLVRGRGAEKVDLLQFSGDTVRPLLEAVAETSRAVKIRLLLYAPVMARQYELRSQDRTQGKDYHYHWRGPITGNRKQPRATGGTLPLPNAC